MELCSTNDATVRVSWRDAVLRGLALDGGLYIPTRLPQFSQDDVFNLRSRTFPELAYTVAERFLEGEIQSDRLRAMCEESFTFPVPLRRLDDRTYVLELFHGPTCAFKDFGARFMARLFRYFWGTQSKPLTVLVATSGDTGSAVANAFFDATPNPPIRVAILYPRGKVTTVQRKQMTTLGHNVTAFEVDGTFDDCQAFVKQGLRDERLLATTALTSANSINIARLLPQMFYYAYAALQLSNDDAAIFSVPSGNLGNLTGGLLAHACGFSALHFIAACNANATFPEFIRTGSFTPTPSRETISNAMDVGNPSNFYRILAMRSPEGGVQDALISSYSISDGETRSAMQEYYDRFKYILDPHTAVGACALMHHRSQHNTPAPAIIVSTAHPAKFSSTVRGVLNVEPEIPTQLIESLNKTEKFVELPRSYEALVSELLR